MAEVVEPHEDLRGILGTTSIVDVLQFLHVGGRTGALDLVGETAGDAARVFLSHGHVSHVELGDAAGIDALATLIGWRGGGFRFTSNVMCATVTIEEPFQAALMEAIRRHDEAAKRPPEDESPLAAELVRFVAQTGVRAAVLLDPGGEAPVVAGETAELDVKALAAATSHAAAAASQLGDVVAGGPLHELLIAFDGLEVMAHPVGAALLLVIAGPGTQLGVLRHKTHRLADSLGATR